MRRRTFLSTLGTAVTGVALGRAAAPTPFRLNYLLASSLFGNLPLAQILPVVKQTGATAIELWPKNHGTQREELDTLGLDRFAGMLHEHGLTFGGTTRLDRGPLRLTEELDVVRQLGGKIIVCGGSGNAKAKG